MGKSQSASGGWWRQPRADDLFESLAPQVQHMGEEMTNRSSAELADGASCTVVKGTHAGKAGTVRDIRTSKGGHVTITVVQADGVRLKTLARNVVVHVAH
jgi:ribosomal protein S4E